MIGACSTAYSGSCDPARLAEAAMHLLASEEPNESWVRPTQKGGGTFSSENDEESTPNIVVGAQERIGRPHPEVPDFRDQPIHPFGHCVPVVCTGSKSRVT